ncbi:hypothetical protein FT638_09450 [Bacillus cereus]|nr:hypothetical protein [Bacillus cereus]
MGLLWCLPAYVISNINRGCLKGSGRDNLRMSSLHCQCGTHVGKLHSVSSWRMRLDLLGSLDPPF